MTITTKRRRYALAEAIRVRYLKQRTKHRSTSNVANGLWIAMTALSKSANLKVRKKSPKGRGFIALKNHLLSRNCGFSLQFFSSHSFIFIRFFLSAFFYLRVGCFNRTFAATFDTQVQILKIKSQTLGVFKKDK